MYYKYIIIYCSVYTAIIIRYKTILDMSSYTAHTLCIYRYTITIYNQIIDRKEIAIPVMKLTNEFILQN